MDNNQLALSSLAMDLKRVALGYHRGSTALADRFLEEALKRKEEIKTSSIPLYVKNILNKLQYLSLENKQKAAEDALLFSTLIQNAVLTRK